MATEYKLSYTASEIDSKLGKVDNTVLFTEQTLTDTQKARARKNLDVIERSDCISNVENYNVQNKVFSSRLSGLGKDVNSPMIQSADAESTIFVQYNDCTVEHLRLSNKDKYSDKIAIDVAYPSQMLSFYDIIIEDGYTTGIRLPSGYYSQFNSCWIRGDTGISIGNEDGGGWIGVLDFNACHLNDSGIAVMVNAIDTNTICFDKCSFEGDDISIVNQGTVYVRNSYFGDQLDTGNKHGVLVAKAGSKTYFSDSTVTLSAFNDGGRESIFDLRSDNELGGSVVFVNGGLLGLSNSMNVQNSQATIYASDSPNNLIYIDFATFMDNKAAAQHNRTPYYIYDGFTPLRSKFPLRNYVCNGTMKSELGNALLLESSPNAVFDSDMMNPFGGSILKATADAKYFYKIPKHCVGEEMTLEFYLYTPVTDGFYLESEGLGNIYFNDVMHTYEDERKPVLYRITVVPTAEAGYITMKHSNNFNVYGVVLKESHYGNMLSCYEDIDELYSDKIPTNITSARFGDVVHNIDMNNDDWLYDGTNWKYKADSLTYSLDFSGGKLTLNCSDGSSSAVTIAATKGILYMLSNCTSSNSDTTVLEGEAYSALLIPNEDHVLTDVTVTMGGIDVTSYVYDSITGQINIESATGTIIITASAVYTTWSYTVPDIRVAIRNAWWRSMDTHNITCSASNEYLGGIGVYTENELEFEDRDGNKLYPIPVPRKASKVVVNVEDTIDYDYEFIGVKMLNNGETLIATHLDPQENNTFQWTAGQIDYIIINCITKDKSYLPETHSGYTVSVVFSKWEDDETI